MRNFDYTQLADYKWDNEILRYVAKIYEVKGKQELYIRQKPMELDRLVEIAKIRRTEASNRIEGIITTNTRFKQIVKEKVTPRNRDEREILGYQDVLNTIHECHDFIPITMTREDNAHAVVLLEELYNNLLENAYIRSDKANIEWLIKSKNQYTNQNLKKLDTIEE